MSDDDLLNELGAAHVDLEEYERTKPDAKTGLPKRFRDPGDGTRLRWPRAITRRLDAARNEMARRAAELDRLEADHPRILAKLREEGRTLAAFERRAAVPA